jgi:hypothetical protein
MTPRKTSLSTRQLFYAIIPERLFAVLEMERLWNLMWSLERRAMKLPT